MTIKKKKPFQKNSWHYRLARAVIIESTPISMQNLSRWGYYKKVVSAVLSLFFWTFIAIIILFYMVTPLFVSVSKEFTFFSVICTVIFGFFMLATIPHIISKESFLHTKICLPKSELAEFK